MLDFTKDRRRQKRKCYYAYFLAFFISLVVAGYAVELASSTRDTPVLYQNK